jgi:phage-related holin
MSDVKFYIVNSFLATLTAIVTATGTPDYIVTSLAFLVLIDWITGVWKSVAIGEPIESRYGTVGFLSKCTILLAPLTVAYVGRGVGVDVSLLVTFMFSALVVNEGYSALSNLSMIHLKKELPEWSALEIMFGEIQKFMLSILKRK